MDSYRTHVKWQIISSYWWAAWDSVVSIVKEQDPVELTYSERVETIDRITFMQKTVSDNDVKAILMHADVDIPWFFEKYETNTHIVGLNAAMNGGTTLHQIIWAITGVGNDTATYSRVIRDEALALVAAIEVKIQAHIDNV
jgi:hypothetical protein